MYIFPYINRFLETELTPKEIQTTLSELTRKPSWRFKTRNLFDNHIFEGKVETDYFVIFRGSGGLTYGKTSLWPRLYGYVFRVDESSLTKIYLKIRPSWGGIIIYFCVLFLAFLILFRSIGADPTGVTVSIGFVFLSYFSLVYTFNKVVREYDQFINRCFEQGVHLNDLEKKIG